MLWIKLFILKYNIVALIMWNDIQPTEGWIESQVPDTIKPFCMVTPSPAIDVDYEAMKYVNLITS